MSLDRQELAQRHYCPLQRARDGQQKTEAALSVQRSISRCRQARHAVARGRGYSKLSAGFKQLVNANERTEPLNAAYLSAISALAGSAIGALASFITTWITQHYQGRQTRQAMENARRERLFGDFIDQASKVYADAMVSALDDPAKLVMVYATLSKLRLFASQATIAAAVASLSHIVDTYYGPNADFSRRKLEEGGEVDLLQAFTQAAREELRE